MKSSTVDRTGVLIVRLWIESNHETGMRARITQTLDTMATEHSVALVASSHDICAVVKQWVEDFSNQSSSDSMTPTENGERS
jgi:hypothetical protein